MTRHERVAIIGADGMLGRAVTRACARRGMDIRPYANRRELDVTDAAAVEATIGPQTELDLVINCAGWTDVDGAEDEPVAAYAANWGGAANLAWCARTIGATLIHVSSDYVFDGTTRMSYDEEAPTSPLNVYGTSKVAGEEAIRSADVDHLIVRTSWLFAPHGHNFVRTILERARTQDDLFVVDDQIGRPTSCRDLADMMLDLHRASARGTFHAANEGTCTWYDLARTIVRSAGLECAVHPRPTSASKRPARRPKHAILDLAKMTKIIGPPRTWREALGPVLLELIGEPAVTAAGGAADAARHVGLVSATATAPGATIAIDATDAADEKDDRRAAA